MKKEVLIIGGGFAGLAAGVELSSRGHPVTLIERRGHLGGRAYSFKDPVTGSILDNGQHLLMGCYGETAAFLKKIGTFDKVSFQKNLTVDFAGPGETGRFRALPLPSPFHLAGGFLFFRGLPWRDRLKILSLARALKRSMNGSGGERSPTSDKTIPEWLQASGQGRVIQERFWNPLALAALNDRPEICSAAVFSAVLKEALFSGRKGAALGISTVGLSDLYTEAARDFIERKGGHLLLKSPVVKLHFKGREFQEAELEGGRRISAEALLVTVPFTALRRLLPDEILYGDPFFRPLGRLQNSPIVAINLWFDREITQKPFVGFWGTKIHWLFNKGRLFREGPPYLSLVISGARDELKTPAPALIDLALREMGEIFPEVGRAKLVRSMVLKEPEATFSPEVGVSAMRLPQKTPYKNLFLAGDWTDTGLPATIEGAVRSAKKAVELIEKES